MHGCYEALEGGTTDEALAALTGFPCERLSLQPPDKTRGNGGGGGGGAVASWGAEGEAFDLDVLWARLLSFDEVSPGPNPTPKPTRSPTPTPTPYA